MSPCGNCSLGGRAPVSSSYAAVVTTKWRSPTLASCRRSSAAASAGPSLPPIASAFPHAALSFAPLLAPGFPCAIHPLELLIRERSLQLLLQRRQCRGTRRTARTARHDEPQRAIQLGYFRFRQRAGKLLR